MTVKGSASTTKGYKYLPPGKYICEIEKVFTEDKDGEPLKLRGDNAIRIVLKCIAGEHAGKSHLESLALTGKMSWKTVQLLKAVKIFEMNEEVKDFEFEEEELLGKVIGVELEKRGEYTNAKSFMIYDDKDDDDIPF